MLLFKLFEAGPHLHLKRFFSVKALYISTEKYFVQTVLTKLGASVFIRVIHACMIFILLDLCADRLL